MDFYRLLCEQTVSWSNSVRVKQADLSAGSKTFYSSSDRLLTPCPDRRRFLKTATILSYLRQFPKGFDHSTPTSENRSILTAPPATVVYEAEVPEEHPDVLTWTWLERGGGWGVADFGRCDVTMNWNPWRFAVDVELTRERDGRLGATVSTDEPGLELEQTQFFADDPWKERWYEKFEVGFAGGYGNGFTIQGHAGWGGWNVYVQHYCGGETYSLGKTWRIF